MNRFILTLCDRKPRCHRRGGVGDLHFIYRTAVIGGISAITESSSEVAARFALHPIRESIAEYLELAAKAFRPSHGLHRPWSCGRRSPNYHAATRKSRISRSTIRRGIVIFSTDRLARSEGPSDNPASSRRSAETVS